MIGISTYAYLWRLSDRMPEPLTLDGFLDDAARHGVGLVQICDNATLDHMMPDGVQRLRARATALGLAIEIGTRGVATDHLLRYLELAVALECTLVRTMIAPHEGTIDLEWATDQLRAAMPAFERAGVTLAIETYEQVPTSSLIATIEAVDSAALGICLDPGNSIAALELPSDVVRLAAPLVRNIHVKDFCFTRDDGTVGFRLTGAPLGQGALDVASMAAAVRPAERGINLIIEQWLPWQHDPAATADLEARWLDVSLAQLRALEPLMP